MSINVNITTKKYKRLSLQVHLNGFTFCVFDTLDNKILSVKEVDFTTFPKAKIVEDYYWKSFVDNPELKDLYDEILVLHDSNLDTFVPKALFDERYLGNYLQYNTKVFTTDFFAFDIISNYEMHHVYIPFANINNFLIDQFATFNYKHASSILVSKLLDYSKNVEEKKIFVHFSVNKFEIVIVQNQKLLLFNSFDFVTNEDFIYYLLFTTEQLNLNPEQFNISLLGEISEESELFQIAYKYIRNVTLFNISDLQKNNDFSNAQNLKHFILFQS